MMGQVKAAVWKALRLAGVDVSTPGGLEVAEVITWLCGEHSYQCHKFSFTENDGYTKDEGLADGYWEQQLATYWGRAQVLGLETEGGRQALAKFVATSCGLLESVIRVHGHLPRPGTSSGSLEEAHA